jgi:5-methyltetrahydropteroyltriglutamate--homocysteine methyltransferase
MTQFAKSTILGYPRIGRNRELKRAEEAYWAGKISREELEKTASELRLQSYEHLKSLGLSEDWAIPLSFSYYDQVLDAAVTFGAVPERFEQLRKVASNDYSLHGAEGQRESGSFGERMRRPSGVDEFDLDDYFTIARGLPPKGFKLASSQQRKQQPGAFLKPLPKPEPEYVFKDRLICDMGVMAAWKTIQAARKTVNKHREAAEISSVFSGWPYEIMAGPEANYAEFYEHTLTRNGEEIDDPEALEAWKTVETALQRVFKDREAAEISSIFSGWPYEIMFGPDGDYAGYFERNRNRDREMEGLPPLPIVKIEGLKEIEDDDDELGVASASGALSTIPAEMTKWFDTNYHYLVPEFYAGTKLSLANYELVRQFKEALNAGHKVRPVIVGPVTFLALGKYHGIHHDQLVSDLIASYSRLLNALASAGAQWVQLDEPALISETHGFSAQTLAHLAQTCYGEFAKLSADQGERPNILLTTPYGKLDELSEVVNALPVEALHLDLASDGAANALVAGWAGAQGAAAGNSAAAPAAGATGATGADSAATAAAPAPKQLVAGVVNGRNIWRSDLPETLEKLEQLAQVVGVDNLTIATSCSLQHVPHTLEDEQRLSADFPELMTNLSFADEKITEIVDLANALTSGSPLAEKRAPKSELSGRNVEAVHERLRNIQPSDLERESIEERKEAQQARLQLPNFRTTTIGSFPQTAEIRKARQEYRDNRITQQDYEAKMYDEIRKCVALQEEIGLDVLVHGEPERNDMVQYFAENFEGFDVTENGWVQSYGSRCTKPSVLWGDVYRKESFTVQWIAFAQSLTNKPMKGMLTGPVTILAWSFVRDDQPRADTANQVALALRDEIEDLEAAKISIIQVDEPALRELLPLKKADQGAYLEWSVNAFRLATSSVRVDTQIHTHLCYSEFEVVLPAIIALNADVTSIEAARSKMEIVEQLVDARYPLGIGPGVYDIHSPRVPSYEELYDLINSASEQFIKADLPVSDLWVNPDCGLKTRASDEVIPALTNMAKAAQQVLKEYEEKYK